MRNYFDKRLQKPGDDPICIDEPAERPGDHRVDGQPLTEAVNPDTAGYLTIDRVQCDMNAQSQSEQPGFFVCEQGDVDADG